MGISTKIILASLLISLVFLGVMGVMVSVADANNITVSEEYQEIFDEYNATEDIYNENQEIIEGGEINPEGQDQAVYSNIIIAAKQATQSAKILVGFLGKIPQFFGIPPALIVILATMVFVLVTAGFIYLMTGRKP